MCGIAGVLGSRSDTLGVIGLMARQVRHRGPDDEGYVVFHGADLVPDVLAGESTVDVTGSSHLSYLPRRGLREAGASDFAAGLAHQRLSIVDLSAAGHQPMATADDRAWIAYNGEIYNYRELRAELERAGHAFRTRTDTEVILAGYRQWGIGCLDRLNGMFAFLLLDRDRRTCLAARDRFGIKPLYYWRSPRGFVAFASEIKQFVGLPGWRPVVNGQMAYNFLAWGVYDHSHETLFQGVRQLRGGEYLELPLDEVAQDSPHALVPRRWYALPSDQTAMSMDEAAEGFRSLFSDSVLRQLQADVRVGSCLSGGLDSSAIVCTIREHLQEANGAGQDTFSACWDVPKFDERPYQRAVVEATGVRSHEVHPDPEGMFEALDRFAWVQDEPYASPSMYAQWCVFRRASEAGVKVMLDGQGADEALGGYHGFFGAMLAELAGEFRFARLAAECRSLRHMHGYGPRWVAARLAAALAPRTLGQRMQLLSGRLAAPRWLDLQALGASRAHPLAHLERAGTRDVAALSRLQLQHTSLPALLHWEDRSSMAYSVEARVPFLDHRLVEFVLRLPAELKISHGVTKRVLREAMAGCVPERVLRRTDKLGFQPPEREWLVQHPGRFRARMRDAIEASRGIMRSEASEALESAITGRTPFSYLPWRMIAFGTWMKVFGVQRQ